MIDNALKGTLLNEQVVLSLDEISEACFCRRKWIVELVNEGVLEPSGARPEEWSFSGSNLSTAQTARRLHRDLGINLAGIALVLELLAEVQTLRSQTRNYESRHTIQG